MKILIIEDEPAIAQTLTDILSLNDHSVTVATDGDSGLRCLQARPELVFCDVGLPGMNGFDVLRAARQQPHLGDIPFIFVTALSDPQKIDALNAFPLWRDAEPQPLD